MTGTASVTGTGEPDRDGRAGVRTAPHPTGSERVHVVATVVTHPGLVRGTNEDAVAVGSWTVGVRGAGDVVRVELSRPGPVTVVLADGLGGHRAGEQASRLAVDTVAANASRMVGEGISQVLDEVNVALTTAGTRDPRVAGAGCTVAGITFDAGTAWVFNVGDSRVYRLMNGYLGQLSVDDRPDRPGGATTSVLTQCLGGGRDLRVVEPHLAREPVQPQDEFLLCSDGLSDYVGEAALGTACSEPDRTTAVRRMLDDALRAGAPDNVTILLVSARFPAGATEPSP